MNVEVEEHKPTKTHASRLRLIATTGRGGNPADYLAHLDAEHGAAISRAMAAYYQSALGAAQCLWVQAVESGWLVASLTGEERDWLLAVVAPSLASNGLKLETRERLVYVATLDGSVSVLVGVEAYAWRPETPESADGPASVVLASLEEARKAKLTREQRDARDEVLFLHAVRCRPGVRGVSRAAELVGLDPVSASAACKRLLARGVIENRGIGPSRPQFHAVVPRLKITRWRRAGGAWTGRE